MWKFWTERQRCRNKPPKKATEVQNCQNIKFTLTLEGLLDIKKLEPVLLQKNVPKKAAEVQNFHHHHHV